MERPRLPASVTDLFNKRPSQASGSPVPDAGMDRTIAPKPRWRKYAPWTAGAVLMVAAATWALWGAGGNVYRVPLNRLTIGTVREGPFEDYIAVRGAVAPFITAYLTTDQGGTVKQVLVEDGAKVKSGQPLV